MAEIGGIRPAKPVIAGIPPRDQEKHPENENEEEKEKDKDEENKAPEKDESTPGEQTDTGPHIDVTV